MSEPALRLPAGNGPFPATVWDGYDVAMPAECEVGGCGVLAIGRCTTCNLAFCGTHQARESTGTKYVDQCGPCLGSQRAAEAQTERDQATVASELPGLFPRVVEAMVEHDVGGLEERTFHWEVIRTIERRWRAPIEQREECTFVGARAWPIGTFCFPDKYSYVGAAREVGVTTKPAIVLMPAGVRDISRFEDVHGFKRVESGRRPTSDLDDGLLGLKLPTHGTESAVRRLDRISRDHGLDLADVLDWSAVVVAKLRG